MGVVLGTGMGSLWEADTTEVFLKMRPWGSRPAQRLPLKGESLFLLCPGHSGKLGTHVSEVTCARAAGTMQLGFLWFRYRVKESKTLFWG